MNAPARGLLAPLRGLGLAGPAPFVLLHGLASLLLWGPVLGIGMLLGAAPPIETDRALTNRWRRLVAALSGVAVPVPYLPPPARPTAGGDGLFRVGDELLRSERVAWQRARLRAWSQDRATGRDLAWLFTYPFVALVAAVPAALIVGGVVAPLRGAPLWTALAVPVGLGAGPLLVQVPGRWTRRLLAPAPAPAPALAPARRWGASGRWVERRGLIQVRLAALAGLSLLAPPLLALSLVGLLLGLGVGLVFLVPPALQHVRWLADLRRGLARDWSGVPVADPYRPLPAPVREPDGRYRVGRQRFRSERTARFSARFDLVWKDPAGWRDLLWLALDPLVGGTLAAVPVLLVGYGVGGLALPGLFALAGGPHGGWYGEVAGQVPAAVPVGVALALAGDRLGPLALRAHGRWTRVLLRPTRAGELARQVERLTRTRTDAVDDRAREVRRIERDLHDGAQARLVALGLTLGAVERLLEAGPATGRDADPDAGRDADRLAARRLVAQAQDISATALLELRRLVRGIHPPVLAERGLADAVRALALDAALPVEVTADLPFRLDAATESAAYFAVSEAMTNAVRHAGADRIAVEVGSGQGRLRLAVRDDGRGGADPDGSGLTGIRRRLAALDGTLTVTSPPGGPTVIEMELPCASSSPKTSTSCGTG